MSQKSLGGAADQGGHLARSLFSRRAALRAASLIGAASWLVLAIGIARIILILGYRLAFFSDWSIDELFLALQSTATASSVIATAVSTLMGFVLLRAASGAIILLFAIANGRQNQPKDQTTQ